MNRPEPVTADPQPSGRSRPRTKTSPPRRLLFTLAGHGALVNDDEQRQLEHARRALVEKFAGRLPSAEVERRFGEVVRSFERAPVRAFVPLLVQSTARRQLESSAGS